MYGRGAREAVKALCEELSRHWLMPPDGWVSEYPAKTYIASGQRAGPESFYRQIKELKFYIQPGQISESDKLNAIQFTGTCEFTNSPARVYGDPNAFGPPKWSDWKPSSETVRIEKRNGKWSFASVLGYLTTGTKPADGTISRV